MEEPKELLAVIVFLGVLLLYREILVFTRTVPPEYLNEQSVVESSRNPNELAIHKSTKLDYLQGLRVGLGIRYHHYKLRNGNLYDVWELALANAQHSPPPTVFVNDETIQLKDLNSRAIQLKCILARASITEIWIPSSLYVTDISILSVMIACFISQITVHVHHDSIEVNGSATVESLNGAVRIIVAGTEIFNSAQIKWNEPSLEFINEYSFEKDKGIALRVSNSTNHMSHTTTDFTQSNLVSAVASCIKHLPPHEQFGSKDLLAVVQDTLSSEGITNGVVKLLAGLMSGCRVLLSHSEHDFMSKKPTIVSANLSVISKLQHQPSGFDRLLYWHKMASLFCLRFSTVAIKRPYPGLRLLYAHRKIGQEDYREWNSTRAALSVLVVEEYGYFNAAGPILTTDVYDFRFQKRDVTSLISGTGCIVQSNEIKLTNYSKGEGDVAVRGYNFGKAKQFMKGKGEISVQPDAEGFYSLPIKAKWGSDGCLYLFK